MILVLVPSHFYLVQMLLSAMLHFVTSIIYRMEDYFYYQWFNSKGIDKTDMMETWPRTLKEDTSLFLHRYSIIYTLISSGIMRF